MLEYNKAYFGDCLTLLSNLEDQKVDLIYLDPPFNTGRILTATNDKNISFNDKWYPNVIHQNILDGAKNITVLNNILIILENLLKNNESLLTYCTYMSIRLYELHRVLKNTGSLYLHCDGNASHYLKIILDQIFGFDCFQNNVVWLYGLGGSSPKRWPKKHDDILFYTKSKEGYYFQASKIPATSNMMQGQLKKAPDWWDIPAINNMSKERIGYPTQKPLALLKRIVESSSKEEDLVLDPFCGSGTTLIACKQLNRKYIGFDISYDAITILNERLQHV